MGSDPTKNDDSAAKFLVELLPLFAVWASVPGYVYTKHYFSEIGLAPQSIDIDTATMLGRTLALVSEPRWILIGIGALSLTLLLAARRRVGFALLVWIVAGIGLYHASSWLARTDARIDRSDETTLRLVELDVKDCPRDWRPANSKSGPCHVSGRLIRQTSDRIAMFVMMGPSAKIDYNRPEIIAFDSISNLRYVNP